MIEQGNESKYREELDKESKNKNANDINVCTWCKEQIPSGEAYNHVYKCSVIPPDEKERMLQTRAKATEVIHGADRKKG
jgi:hypothetical protein